MQEVKRAKEIAEVYLMSVFPDASGIVLEEVEPGDGEHRWLLTLSYRSPREPVESRSMVPEASQLAKDILGAIHGRGHDARSGRTYKRFDVDVERAEVLSMTIRELGLV